MTHTWVELHDSEVLEIHRSGLSAVLVLDAYVHRWEQEADRWRGTGWTQPVRCTIAHVAKFSNLPMLPAHISAGRLHTPDSEPGNLIPLPFSHQGPARLSLIFDTGAEFELEGDGARVESIGPAQYVEKFPADMRPDVAG